MLVAAERAARRKVKLRKRGEGLEKREPAKGKRYHNVMEKRGKSVQLGENGKISEEKATSENHFNLPPKE